MRITQTSSHKSTINIELYQINQKKLFQKHQGIHKTTAKTQGIIHHKKIYTDILNVEHIKSSMKNYN